MVMLVLCDEWRGGGGGEGGGSILNINCLLDNKEPCRHRRERCTEAGNFPRYFERKTPKIAREITGRCPPLAKTAASPRGPTKTT